MRVLKILAGVGSVVVGLLFFAPLIVTLWVTLFPESFGGRGHTDFLPVSLEIGRFVLTGGQMWLALIIFAAVGLTFILGGTYALRRRGA